MRIELKSCAFISGSHFPVGSIESGGRRYQGLRNSASHVEAAMKLARTVSFLQPRSLSKQLPTYHVSKQRRG
jgi:hypothetical protein